MIARNAMREIEVFLPLSFLGAQSAAGTADAFLTVFALLWSGIFLLFPLFDRDRLRAGNILAGTWAVRVGRRKLAADLIVREAEQPRRSFGPAALSLYGIYELQTLKDVLHHDRDDAVTVTAAALRDKAEIADDGDDDGLLSDHFAARCFHLGRELMVGWRRARKAG